MSSGKTANTEQDRYKVKTIVLSEDGPGAYSLMVIRLQGMNNRALERAGYGGGHTLMHLVDSVPRGVYHDPFKMLREEGFTGEDSIIDEFLKELCRNDKLFFRLKDGMKYEVEDMEALVNG